MTSEALCLGTSTYPALRFNIKNTLFTTILFEARWKSWEKWICFGQEGTNQSSACARTSITGHCAPSAFCQDCNSLRGQGTVLGGSYSASPATREPTWDAAGDVAVALQRALLVSHQASARLQPIPAHLERDAAAPAQGQTPA